MKVNREDDRGGACPSLVVCESKPPIYIESWWSDSSAVAPSSGGVDLAILDYHVKDGDTTELAKHLRRTGVPFIVCSGSGGWEELGEVFAGARFLAKPYSADSLVAAVSGAANSNVSDQ